MDFLYGHVRKLSDFEEPDMTDILESDMFQSSGMGNDSYMDNDWLNSLFDDPVLNDKMMTEAVQPPCIKSEHSYSITNSDHNPASPLPLGKLEDMDSDMFSSSSNLDVIQKSQLIQAAATASQSYKSEQLKTDPLLATTTACVTSTTSARPTTILLTTTTSSTTSHAFSHCSQPVFPSTLQIKQEPVDSFDMLQDHTVSMDSVMLPPTPPSSAGSDSDGSQSPQRSAPNSPQRQSPVRLYHIHQPHHANSPPLGAESSLCRDLGLSQPLFLSPMPQSGVLILTEEEKRTLISEGYPIPTKLPLTKQEEKNLKKVRRKIKNKISAQESRRKKKEYLEALEKRVEAYNHENSDLKKKVESLENNNRSLLGQLQKLQALVGRMPKPSAASATQTGTVLMVLVLCFAVFLGGFGPTSLNIGYTGAGPSTLVFQQPSPLRPQPNMGPGVVRAQDTSDAYATPNLKSRVLMSLARDEVDDWCNDYRPLFPWQQDQSCPMDAGPEDAEASTGLAEPGPENMMPTVPGSFIDSKPMDIAVVTVAVGAAQVNSTESAEEYQALMHPDIAVSPMLSHLANFTAELETA
ncbi:cyclic AMP-responsive element-binding protein 3-like protein 1 isoform X1 [Pomacea canaliculata]|uniref:cyclic AMP-responsive element-binding protein 3-like protein 1 isoform X1 n=1 Tax=Pomacea canaliculata TaxID=400727 RepID=UPI000D72888A|nr:cyclic AMP-responsive element-binding protein 3-like protein 1 isoform X1 [Pomacea canaliculata]